MKIRHVIAALLSAVVLSACSGGYSSSIPSASFGSLNHITAPVAPAFSNHCGNCGGGGGGGSNPGGGVGGPVGGGCPPNRYVVGHVHTMGCSGGGTGNVTGGAVAIQPGPPSAGKGCWGSPGTVDDSFYNQNKQDVEITDINSLWVNGRETGWLYLGSDGKTYIQYNYQDQAVWSWAVSIGIASGGASTPGGYSSIMPYNGGSVTNVAGGVQAGTQPQQCFQQGQYLGGNFG